jgi:hypothetical protein
VADVTGTSRRGSFDALEKELVFRVSRVFFWILCGTAGLAFVAAVCMFVLNAIPPVKSRIAEPQKAAEVTVTPADIEQTLNPRQPERVSPPEPQGKQPLAISKGEQEQPAGQTVTDLQAALLKVKLDTLRSCFPADKYVWETVYGNRPVEWDYWHRVTRTEKYVQRYGLDQDVTHLLQMYEDSPAKIRVVSELTGIMAKTAVDNRGRVLAAYIDLRRGRESERQAEIARSDGAYRVRAAEAEATYAAAKLKRAAGVRDALKYAGAAFTGVALIGLFLCFLAIERNTRALAALLEREKTS